MKNCPYCGEEIQDAAKKCRYCGEWLAEETKYSETKIENEEDSFIIPGLGDKLHELVEKGGMLDLAIKSLIADDVEIIMSIISPSCILVCGEEGKEEQPFPDKPTGMALSLSFCSKHPILAYNILEERRHERFMELSISESFMHRFYPERDFYCDEYVIDFGEDIESATKIISQIASKVFNCTESNAPRMLLAQNNKQREQLKNELLKDWGIEGGEQGEDKNKSYGWIVGLCLLVCFFIIKILRIIYQ